MSKEKHLKISEKTHNKLKEFKEKEEIKTYDGAIRLLINEQKSEMEKIFGKQDSEFDECEKKLMSEGYIDSKIEIVDNLEGRALETAKELGLEGMDMVYICMAMEEIENGPVEHFMGIPDSVKEFMQNKGNDEK